MSKPKTVSQYINELDDNDFQTLITTGSVITGDGQYLIVKRSDNGIGMFVLQPLSDISH